MPIGPWELGILLFILGGPILLGVLGIVFVIYLITRTRNSDQTLPKSATWAAS